MFLTAEARTAARAEIVDCLANYARAVDRKQWDLVRNSFHEDAYDDHGPFKGTVSEFIEWVAERHSDVVQSMHVLSNTLIEFVSAERALVETYFASYKSVPQEPDGNGGSSFANYRVLGAISMFLRIAADGQSHGAQSSARLRRWKPAAFLYRPAAP
jgi:hypothetical protein